MGSITKVFQDEMARAARKEIRSAIKGLKAEVAKLSATVASLRREVAALKKGKGSTPAVIATPSVSIDTDLSKARFTSEGLRALRKRMGLSQREMAALVKVSTQAVYLWERKGGKLRLRNDSRRVLLKIREMSRTEVRKWVDSVL